MFNFNELKKLKFGEVFENIGSTTPKGNTGVYETQEYNNVMTGAILCIGSAIASTIISILLILGVAALFFEIPLGETDLSVSLDVVMIGVLIYTVVNKTKAHNSWFEYIATIRKTQFRRASCYYPRKISPSTSACVSCCRM